MNWNYNEIVRSGNSQARVKNFYPDTGLIILYDIKGIIEAGMTIVGDESNTSLTLTTFEILDIYDFDFDPTYWDDILENVIHDGNGNWIALDEHFTGKPSQDYQITYLVVQN